MKKMMAIIFGLSIVAVFANAKIYNYVCLPYALHYGQGGVLKKFSKEERAALGKMEFVLDTDKNSIMDQGTIPYKYVLTVKTEAGNVSIYKNKKVQIFIKDYQIKEQYQSVGLSTEGDPDWSEFICEVKTENN